jgi:putative membrane protein
MPMSDLNDPRVFFAAERTLLAWNRTSLSMMAFGFVIERFGLFVSILLPKHDMPLQRGLSFWTGLIFVLLGAVVAAYSTVQYRKLISTLKPIEIPEGYRTDPGVISNLIVAAMGIVLTVYFFQGI